MATKILITPDYVCKKGDVIELNYDLVGPHWLWLQAAESTMIENRLKAKYDDFDILSYEWTNDNSRLTITIKDKNDVTIALIAAAIITVTFFAWFTWNKDAIYKIVNTMAAPVSLIAVAVIGYFVLQLFGKGAFAKK